MKKRNGLSEFRKQFPKEYNDAKNQGLLERLCDEMGWCNPKYRLPNIPISYWSKENCLLEAKKHKSRIEWRRYNTTSVKIAVKNGWYEECCEHMIEIQKPAGFWHIKKNCLDESLKYLTRSEWAKKSAGSYRISRKKGWMNECCEHMTEINKPKGHWTLENCKIEASKFPTKISWKDNSGGSYVAACQNKWVDECSVHMVEKRHPAGYWTLERCKEDALKYNTRYEWQKDSGGYASAIDKGWLDECCAHMTVMNRPAGYWTFERCKESALNYTTRTMWYESDNASYSAAGKNGWMRECTKHMERKKRNE